ncbi:condensin complex subunit 3-like [Octopus sinensis]|uniref:Condensin complex subunit 3-like n=1 Tax=Octopus sinensis TaxID=2607531 RepID=A0A6P7TYK6_9MOLL|nr:condensin complex subunit 3-like [Octopus sinensis]
MIQHDPNYSVRLTVLESVAIVPGTLPFILERTFDTNNVVRRAAFSIIGSRVEMSTLSIQQRLDLLRYGLVDNCESVRTACSKMLVSGWLGYVGGDVISLLEHFDVESDLELVEKAVKLIFKDKTEDFVDQRFLKFFQNSGF